MLNLSKRLTLISEMTPKGHIADIGADHGKLLISLCLKGKILSGTAIENKKGPFERLKKAIKEAGAEDKITPLFSDGISNLPSDTNIIVLAGMGGNNILDILTAHKEKLTNIEYIVVDAHNAISDVRKGITSLGYFIKDENILKEDDIFYEIILFQKGYKEYSSLDFDFGPILRKVKSETYREKWLNHIKDIDCLITKDNIPDKRKSELINEKNKILESL